MCKFLGSLTRLEPTAAGCGSLAQAQASARVDAPTALHFFLQCGGRSPRRMYFFSHESAWICARRTTDHDLVSVMQDKKERKRNRKSKREKCKICNRRNFMRFFFLN